MSRKIPLLTVMGLLAALAMPAAGAPDRAAETRKVHIILTGTVAIGSDFEGDLGGFMGAGGRVDIDLGRFITVSPEGMAVLHWGTFAPACTLNIRFGHGYFGMGPMITLTDNAWKDDIFLKAHLGVRGEWMMVEAIYITGKSSVYSSERVTFVGMTFGIVF
jgi:hypothetical protein